MTKELYKLSELKTMPSQLFDWEHSSRNTGRTVMGLRVKEDGTFKLQCWLGYTPKGYTRDQTICNNETDVAIALEESDGEWFWMHIADYSACIVEPLDPATVHLISPVTGLITEIT